uniref:keratin, type I cytoskeletal 10 n=1 Tax=Erigeron canadensis TaxID=72917 RepID=UPI001CB9D63B|nr:keratin, type I cytoskeletal 10 [Erigeron canadensis]
MSSSTTAVVSPPITTAVSEAADGPVLTVINKRIRNLRKKLNRITQIESKSAVKNKEQEDLVKSKPSLLAAIDELEKLRQPLSAAVDEEIALAVNTHLSVSDAPKPASDVTTPDADVTDTKLANNNNENDDKKEDEKNQIEDLLRLVYFASMFDVKSNSEFNRIMLTRSHERNCCLTYDYVTDDDAVVMLGEHDLDLISLMGSLVISRPVDSTFSHQNALQRCIQHAKLWLENSDQPIDPNYNNVTYAGLREKLEKIIGSEYVKITPEFKVTAEAAGNYAFQVPVQVDTLVNHQTEQKEDNATGFERNETYEDQSSPVEEHPKHEIDAESSIETPAQTEQIETQAGGTDYKDQHVPRRAYQNQRGGGGRNGGIGGGRRGFGNGRGGRSGGRSGPYQNGRNQFNDQPGNYYPRNHHGGRGRGGRGNSGYAYNNHASGVEVAES